jgi:hypothetical protein
MFIKAAVIHKKGEAFQIEEVELAEPKPDEVLVRIVATGVCHTDAVARDQVIPVPFPAVLGHEGSGNWRRNPFCSGNNRSPASGYSISSGLKTPWHSCDSGSNWRSSVQRANTLWQKEKAWWEPSREIPFLSYLFRN